MSIVSHGMPGLPGLRSPGSVLRAPGRMTAAD